MSFSSGPQLRLEQKRRRGRGGGGEHKYGREGWEETRSRILPHMQISVSVSISYVDNKQWHALRIHCPFKLKVSKKPIKLYHIPKSY